MTTPDRLVEQLRALPPDRLGWVADYVHRLNAATRDERLAALRRTRGVLTDEEADEWERVIEEDCEGVDALDW